MAQNIVFRGGGGGGSSAIFNGTDRNALIAAAAGGNGGLTTVTDYDWNGKRPPSFNSSDIDRTFYGQNGEATSGSFTLGSSGAFTVITGGGGGGGSNFPGGGGAGYWGGSGGTPRSAGQGGVASVSTGSVSEITFDAYIGEVGSAYQGGNVLFEYSTSYIYSHGGSATSGQGNSGGGALGGGGGGGGAGTNSVPGLAGEDGSGSSPDATSNRDFGGNAQFRRALGSNYWLTATSWTDRTTLPPEAGQGGQGYEYSQGSSGGSAGLVLLRFSAPSLDRCSEIHF